jgi:hypothetical protein
MTPYLTTFSGTTDMIAALLPVLGTILDKALPDPKAKAEAQLKMLEMAQKGELAVLDADMKLALGQMEVNKVEAATDLYRGGWRPGVGWTCVAGLAYNFVVQPILPWVVQAFGGNVPPMPTIDNETLLVLLTGMLGLGGLRTYERVKGKA